MIEKRIIAHHRLDEASKRLQTSEGSVHGCDRHCGHDHRPKGIPVGRDLAAWIGLVPRQDSDRRQAQARADLETGRSLFAAHPGGRRPCGVEARTTKAGEVPLARTASRPQTVRGRGGGAGQRDGRIAWALLVKGGRYRARALVAAA